MNQKFSEDDYTANNRAWKSAAYSSYQHPLASKEVAKVAKQLFFKEEKIESPQDEPSFGSDETPKNPPSNKNYESSHRGSTTSLGRDFRSGDSFRTSPDKDESDHYSNSSHQRAHDLKVNASQYRNAESAPQYYQNVPNNTFTSQDPDSPFAPQKVQNTNQQNQQAFSNSNYQREDQRPYPFSHHQTNSYQQQSEYDQYQNRSTNVQPNPGMGNNYPVSHSYNPSMHNYSIHGTIPADLNASYISNTSQTSSKRRAKPIVVMNINIGNGKKEEINVFEGDNPFEVAYNFCMRYNLPNGLQPVLAQNIQNNVNNYYSMRSQRKMSNNEPQDLRQLVHQQSHQQSHHQSLVQPQTYQNYNYPSDPDPRMSERAANYQPQPHEYCPPPTLEESMSHRSTANEYDVYRENPKNAHQMKQQYQYEHEEYHDYDDHETSAIKEIEEQIQQLQKKRETYLNKPGTAKFGQQDITKGPLTPKGSFVASTANNNGPSAQSKNKNKLVLNHFDAPAQETFGNYASQSTKHAGEKPSIHERLYAEASKRAGSKSPARGASGTSYSYSKIGKEPITSQADRQVKNENTSYSKIHQEKKLASQRPEPLQDHEKSPKSYQPSKSPVNRTTTPTRQTPSNNVKPAPVNEKKEVKKNPSVAPEVKKVVQPEPGYGQYVVSEPRSTNSNSENYRMSKKEVEQPQQPRGSIFDRSETARKLLEEIFGGLDDDFDGKISIDKVNTEGFSEKIIESLSEVFMALEGGLELNLLDFTNIVNQKRLIDAVNSVYEFDEPEQPRSSKAQPAESNTPKNLRSTKQQDEERQFYSPKESVGSKDSPSTAYDSKIEDERPQGRNPKSILKAPSFEGPEENVPITSKYQQIAAKHFANKK